MDERQYFDRWTTDGIGVTFIKPLKKRKEIETSVITLNCGEALLFYLEKNGMKIDHFSGIPGSQNCIFLPDKTSFNWKSADGVIRINCKENAKNVIEANTHLAMFQNGEGDKTRRYSLIVDNEEDFLAILSALKKIDGNSK